ncbi:MAG: phosphoribosyl-ATP diphosphatase [Bdellovibrionales bacterium]|nr:phosphoribosyl-ATP diphosphatase [Bdellovibrionales bacterium]
MIIPSIDLQGGNAVQLIGGEQKAIDAGTPDPLASRFGVTGEIAVIDLDAAMNVGSNREVIRRLLRIARCRVGGGIRDAKSAVESLDDGAQKIILGTRAVPEILRELPKERVIAALDAKHGEVVVDGWKTNTGRSILERMQELRDYVGGFLVTFVEREGRLGGTNLDQVQALVEAAGSARVTIAGGVTTAEDIRALDQMGADAQVGMALYSGRLHLGDAFAAPLSTDRPDGLWPTVVCDEHGVALGLAYSNLESLRTAIEERRGAYHSRTRGLWRKGASSGAVQELLAADLDCDRDTIRFTVRQQEPGFCHTNTWTCWGAIGGAPALSRVLSSRRDSAPEGSYTARLFADAPLLGKKLREEAAELAEAVDKEHVRWEAADVLYFTLAKLAAHDIPFAEVEQELNRRMLKVTRRPGDAKE